MAKLFLFIVGSFVLLKIGWAEEEFIECPTISNGYYPYCECRYGPKYDEATNTCPNPACPDYNSTGIYPNCMCMQKNFDYSNYINECFRVCPENSSGYWPNCNCDTDGYVFDKSQFECFACPTGSSGEYPNCSCHEDGAGYDRFGNSCEKCEDGSVGIYPSCKCAGEAFYDSYNRRCITLPTYVCENYGDNINEEDVTKAEDNEDSLIKPTLNNVCLQCPFSSTGVYPDCICEPNGTYIESDNFCMQCPFSSYGVYPNCICELNGIYKIDLNECFACPAESTGEYPDCICDQPFQYEKEKNSCIKCPADDLGLYPNCECKNGFYSRFHERCIECPVNSTGFYPDCECQGEDFLFSAYINQCYIACPDNSSGIHPNCQCYHEHFYEADEFTCKSNIGRKCPLGTIGIGPDCLCMLENSKFNSFLWSCIYGDAANFGGISAFCPDDSGKWPQCSASIERNTLISLIG